ncbi:hypothetical protein C4J81_07060 [Deltaproteobacteria bacterium Smac51]|nr:hypothetical protein C4J81_07060 [Deltaproteobacteria bacterium Smac51]
MDSIKIEETVFSEDDVIKAMRDLPGYIDLTPHDFKLLYEKVYNLARRRLLEEKKARDIMTSPAVTITGSATVQELAALLDKTGISGLPVADTDGKLLGVVSEKDVLRAIGEEPTAGLMRLASRSFEERPPDCACARHRPVEEIMTAPAFSVSEEATMAEIVRLFQAKAINRVPVVGMDGAVVGIITRSNVISAVCGI